MPDNTIRERTLLGASPEAVRSWVSEYIRLTGLSCSVDELVARALTVEGTRKGVTKTKVRKARRRLIGDRRS